jgi:ABC-2 type transport system permease protein
VAGLATIVAASFLTGLAFTSLGFAIAWRMESTRGFHAVMNLFLLPLWFLSGAMFPPDGAAPVLQWLVRINPVSYAVSSIRHGVYGLSAAPSTVAGPAVSLAVCAAFAVLMVGAAVWTVRRSSIVR